MNWELPAWALVGLVTGAGLVFLVPQPEPPPPPAPAPEPVAEGAPEPVIIPRDCGGRKRALEGEVSRLEGHLELAEVTLALQDARRVDREGRPSEWPADPDPLLVAKTFEANLNQALDVAGIADLVELDCAEYPCVASIALTVESEIDGVSISEYQAVFDAMNDLGYADYAVGASMAGGARDADGERRKYATFSVSDPNAPGLGKRSVFRTKKLHEASRDAIGEWE